MKKSATADQTVGQTLRYMGWVKKHLADDNGVVEGAIISGYPPDDLIEYALSMIPNVEYQVYCIHQDKVEFLDHSTATMIQKAILKPK